MKLSDFDAAKALVDQLREVRIKLTQIATTNGLGVTIQGQYQNAGILDLVRPVVVAFLGRKIEQIEDELGKLGVTVGRTPMPLPWEASEGELPVDRT